MVGGLGALLLFSATGCEQKEHQGSSNTFSEAAKKEGAFVVVEETAPGVYRIAEEYPSSTTRVILRDLNGTERVLSQQELDELVKKEAAKIEANQSALTNPSIHNQMGLGEVLLSSMAGAIIGAWIGNKLFNNPTYQQRRTQSYKSPSVYERSKNAFTKKSTFAAKKSPVKSGFFGGGTKSGKKSFFSFGG